MCVEDSVCFFSVLVIVQGLLLLEHDSLVGDILGDSSTIIGQNEMVLDMY